MKDTDIVQVTAGDLRRAAAACPEVERALKALKPEVFEEPKLKVGSILRGKHTGEHYLVINVCGKLYLVYLNGCDRGHASDYDTNYSNFENLYTQVNGELEIK